MTHTAVSVIESAGIFLVELFHSLRQTCFRKFSKKMVMIGHEHVRVQYPMARRHDVSEKMEEELAVDVVAVDVALFIAATSEMPDCSRKIES